jgi:hypothetical protein
MSEPNHPAANGAAGPGTLGPEFQQLLRQVLACPRDEKRALLDRLLRDLIGDKPEREYVLCNPDGTAYLFLVHPALRIQFDLTPERQAELNRSSRSTAPTTTLSEVLARLESMG